MLWKVSDIFYLTHRCENYRGTAPRNAAYKILLNTILGKIKPYIEKVMGDYQNGFRDGISVIDNIFTLKIINQKLWEYTQSVQYLYIDFQKLIQCCIVFVLLNAIFMLVCLKRLVSFLICGLWYVKFVHFLISSFSCFWWIFCCICSFRFVTSFSRKLFCAMACIVFHSVCCLSFVCGSDCILVMWYW